MRSIQNIYKCIFYTPNGNMNKTCKDEKRCCIFYEVYCKDYREREEAEEDFSFLKNVFNRPITKSDLIGKHDIPFYITREAYCKSDANIIAQAILVYKIKFRIIGEYKKKGRKK